MQMESRTGPVVSVIIPARNEAVSLGTCLESLVAQARKKVFSGSAEPAQRSLVSDEGIEYEIIVVDDGSTDRTVDVAQSYQVVRVVKAGELPRGWYGKSNACMKGASVARGRWLLFTDADTFHKPGSLARSVAEAEEHGAALLSYSPQQEVHSLGERMLMPLVFAELACVYEPKQVNDPESPVAAANGQFLLISREVYDAVGGHAAVADDLLEDVALAGLVKQSARRLRFRYGGEMVRTRMYRSFSQMCEGWTKNLALLIRSPRRLAAQRSLEFVASVGGVVTAAVAFAGGRNAVGAAAAAIAVPT